MSDYQIKEACVKAFLAKDTFHTMLRYAVPIFTGFMAATIAYGFADIRFNEKQAEKINIIENRLNNLDSAVLAKLDTLLTRRK